MLRFEGNRYSYYPEKNKTIEIDLLNELVKEYPSIPVIVMINNTKEITKEVLYKLDEKIKIRIAGSYDDERIEKQKNTRFKGGKSGEDFYFWTVVYTRNETINIINELEKLEKDINSNWSDVQKLYYYYITLKRNIMYDPLLKVKTDEEIRSLRGLLTKKTVCAGYAVILKELLDRQNIKSYFIGGYKHAWNLVEIEGKLYPIDLTWENELYRCGYLNTNEYFGRHVKEFNRQHIPRDDEPFKDYQDKLSEFDKDFVKYLALTVNKEEIYKKSTYQVKRKNGEMFVLAQIGNKIVDQENYYTYYFREKEDDSIPLIVTTKVNLLDYLNKIDFKKKGGNTYQFQQVIDELLSKENLWDSYQKGTSYIGEIKDYKVGNGYVNKTYKYEEDMTKFPRNYKFLKNKKGNEILIEKDNNSLLLNGVKYYQYNIYGFVDDEDGYTVIKKNNIYSDLDLLNEEFLSVHAQLICEKNIEEAIKKHGGYVGYFDDQAKLSYETNTSFFDSNKTFTVSEYEEMKKKMNSIPRFDEMREYFKRYHMKNADYTSMDTVKIYERGTNKPLEDEKIKNRVFISLVWQDAVGRGLDAFSLENEKIFRKLIGRILNQIENKNMIDTIELLREVYNNPYEKDILINLFSNPGKARLLSEYFYKVKNPEGTYFAEPVVLGTRGFADILYDEATKKRL